MVSARQNYNVLHEYFCLYAGKLGGCTLVCACFLYGSEPLFYDDFSNPAASFLQWNVFSEDGSSLEFNDEKADFNNPSVMYSGFVVHVLSDTPQTFSYSARIVSESIGNGIFYSNGSTGNTLEGYAVVTGDDELHLLSYEKNSVKTIMSYPTRFLDPIDNTLTISGDGERLFVFCNGFFQFSHTDQYGIPIEIALIVPPQARALFDDVCVRNTLIDTLTFTKIEDSLYNVRNYFYCFGNGFAEIDTSLVVIQSITANSYYMMLPLPVADFRLSMRCKYFSSETNGTVGLFTGSKKNDVITPEKRFGISRDCNVIVEEFSNNRFSVLNSLEEVDQDAPCDDWHNLTLERIDGAYIFSVNEDEVYTIHHMDTVSFGLGIYVSEECRITIADFICDATGSLSGTSVINMRNAVSFKNRYSENHIVNLLGQKIGAGSIKQKKLPPHVIIRDGKSRIEK